MSIRKLSHLSVVTWFVRYEYVNTSNVRPPLVPICYLCRLLFIGSVEEGRYSRYYLIVSVYYLSLTLIPNVPPRSSVIHRVLRERRIYFTLDRWSTEVPLVRSVSLVVTFSEPSFYVNHIRLLFYISDVSPFYPRFLSGTTTRTLSVQCTYPHCWDLSEVISISSRSGSTTAE